MGKAQESGLMPSYPMQIEFCRVDYACWYAIPPSPTVPTEIRVDYKLVYDGIPLVFKGSFYVTIGDSGRILEFCCYWRNVVSGETLPITVSPEQAIQNMGNNSLLGRGPQRVKEISINGIEFGYFTPSPFLGADMFLPAYEIKYVAAFEDGSQSAFETYVSATVLSIPY